MIRLGILEDTEEDAKITLDFIDKYSKETGTEFKITRYDNAEAFYDNYAKVYDAILLDIMLPGMNGMELCRKIREKDDKVAVMFITNSANFAIGGYEVNAVDYLLKPLTYEDFALKMKKVIRYIDKNVTNTIPLNVKEGIVLVDDADIYYIEVIKHYLIFHTKNGNYTVRGTMKATEAAVSHSFARCANSYLVNMRHITEVTNNNVTVGGDSLPLTRLSKSAFMQMFSAYVGGIQ